MISLLETLPKSEEKAVSLLNLAGAGETGADFVLIQDLKFASIKRKLKSTGKVDDLGSITTIEREGDVRKADLIIAIGAPSKIAGQSGQSGFSMNNVMAHVTRIRNAFKNASFLLDTFYDAYINFTLSDISVETFNKQSDATAKVKVSIIIDSGSWQAATEVRASTSFVWVGVDGETIALVSRDGVPKDEHDFVYTCTLDLTNSLDVYPVVTIKEKIEAGGQAWIYLYTKYKNETMGLLYTDVNVLGEHSYEFNFENGTITDNLLVENKVVSSRDVIEHLSENGGWFGIPGGGKRELNIAVPSDAFCEYIEISYRERYLL